MKARGLRFAPIIGVLLFARQARAATNPIVIRGVDRDTVMRGRRRS